MWSAVCGTFAQEEDDYVEGAPKLVAEVAASSASIDLHDKKTVYRRNGVREYIVWQILENKLDWFSLQNGEYVSLETDINGVIKSQVFPGLWLSVTDLLMGNMTQVLSVLQSGLNSPEHGAFVGRLSGQGYLSQNSTETEPITVKGSPGSIFLNLPKGAPWI